ncbi:MAG: YncE family protein [Acidobacteria bacterium]|nr:MAG: YncE family protein [Acidobacteriota bacterium]
MRRKGKFIARIAFWLVLPLVLAGVPSGARCQKPGKQVWSENAPCHYGGNGGAFIQGINAHDNLLLSCLVPQGSFASTELGNYVPELVLLRAEDGAEVSRKVVHAWKAFFEGHKGRLYQDIHPKLTYGGAALPAFYIVRGPDAVLMMQVPWLAVVDLENGSIVRPLLPSRDLVNSESPALHIPLREPVPMIASVSPDRGAVAVASNIGSGPKMFIYKSDLTGQIGSWSLPRYAEGIAWSPDGKHVAVLYDGKFDGREKYVGQFPQWMPVRLPDIAVFDSATGAELLNFSTGGPESKIVFSPDGQFIYAISETSNITSLQKDALRVFSSRTGKFVRVIAPNGPRLHDNFALSPDGRFIAADASTARWHPFFTEPTPEIFGNVARVVVLNATTGKVIFSRIRRTSVAFPLNPIFIPDGRLLIVQYGPDRSAKGNQRDLVHIVAYSLAGL